MCPWNKFAQRSPLPDFEPRAHWQTPDLAALLAWDETQFLQRTEGSPIRRIGFERWLRNLAVASGNALAKHNDARLRAALQAHADHPSALVREHVQWALIQ